MSLISSVPPDLRPKPRPRQRIAIPDQTPAMKRAMNRPARRPAPPSDAQLAQQQVSAAFDPVLSQISDAFARRGAAQQAAINGYSKTLADLMGGYAGEARDAYTGAAAGQSAIDAALAATRQGQGAGAQAELAKQLADIHADPSTASRLAGGFSSDLAGEAQAAAGRGAANLSMLLGQGAHAQDYGAKLPTVAASMGLGATQRAQGQITNQLADAISQFEAKRPEAFQTALSNITTTRQRQAQLDLENALARKKFGLDVRKTNASIANDKATLSLRRAVEQANIDLRAQGLAISQQNANTAAYKAQISAQTAAAKAAQKKNPQLTPGQAATISAKAAKDAEDLYHGVTKTNAQGEQIVVSYTQTYQDAIKTLLNRYPSLGRAGVMKLVNSWYKPGQFGRPKHTGPNRSITTGPTLEQARG